MPPENASELEEVVKLTTEFRDMYERMLVSALSVQDTKGTCLHAAILLAQLLGKFANAKAQVKGGGPLSNGGLFDMTGQCHGHYWVEGETSQGVAFIADVTADQFGFNKVMVLHAEAGRHIYSPGSQAEIDEHVHGELETWST